MVVPQDFDYGVLKTSTSLMGWFEEVLKDIEIDGYVTITKIHKFKDVDMVLLSIRGKDPMLSPLKKYTVDARILAPLYSLIKDKVSCNFDIRDGKLYLPDVICTELFNFTAPKEEANINNVISIPTTPMDILWRLIKSDYAVVVDGCAPVPMHKVYFKYDNFEVCLDYIGTDNKKNTLSIVRLLDGAYVYTPFNVIDPKHAEIGDGDFILNTCEDVKVRDDLGRERMAKQVNLKLYEKYMFNQTRFNKLYEKNYTLTVMTRMYKLVSYLDGLGLILSDMGVPCQRFSIPHRTQQTFTLETDKQHNNFSMQMLGYEKTIVDEVATVYSMQRELIAQYLKTKDEKIRTELQEVFKLQCSDKYGQLLHYYVNGILDALAIQKGDKITRTKILSGYYDTVHKEFLMYGCYYYDMRTAFLRNNFRIDKEFSSVFVCNEYNGQYFLVG